MLSQRQSIETHGSEGSCLACNNPISAHVNSNGKWIGCRGCDDDKTQFILLPVPTTQTLPSPTVPEAPKVVKKTTKSKVIDRARFRYIPTDARRKPALSATRAAVYETIRANHQNPEGLLAREILKETKLPHGSVQQTLNWLRSEKLIKAVKVKHESVH